MEEGDDEPRPAHSEWMAERDRAAVHVHLLLVDPELADDGEALRRKRLVQLDEVDLVDADTCALEQLPDCGNRPDAHDTRVDPGDRASGEAAERLDGELLRLRLRPRVLVLAHVVDGEELVVEAARLRGGGPALLRAERERVLVLAAHAPALRDVLAGLAHRLEQELLLQPRVREAPPERRVPDLLVAARERLVRLRQHERRAAHRLDAARYEQV